MINVEASFRCIYQSISEAQSSVMTFFDKKTDVMPPSSSGRGSRLSNSQADVKISQNSQRCIPTIGKHISSRVIQMVRSIFSWLRFFLKLPKKNNKISPFGTDSSGNFVAEDDKKMRSQRSIDSGCSKYASERRFRAKYSNFEVIAQGSFSTVHKAKSRRSSNPVVIKYIKRNLIPGYSYVLDSKLGIHIPSEIAILSRLDHPNITEVLEFSKSQANFILVMPTHGQYVMDLRQFISRLRAIDEPFCSYTFKQIVLAVDYLHGNNILHGDIKADNVIINEEFHCKLIDFGSASYFTKDTITEVFAGSISYCAPEVLLNQGSYLGTDVEMYALGVVLYLLNFQDYPVIDRSHELLQHNDNLHVSSKGLLLLVTSLLDENVCTRCKMHELLENAWLNQKVIIENYVWDKMVWLY